MLSVVKSLLEEKGQKLWGLFEVVEPAKKIIYLIPESGLGPFTHRLELFGLLPHVQSGRLLIRTLSKGPAPKLGPTITGRCQGCGYFSRYARSLDRRRRILSI
jgi:hypothetical protein